MPDPSEDYSVKSPIAPTRLGGFTLIELMITITIMGIFAALAAPSFQNMIASQRIRSATSALTESLWLARSEALKRNAVIAFSFTNISDGWDVKDGGTTLYRQEPFTSVTSDAGNFSFNVYGRMTGAVSIQLGVASASLYRCVTVSTTGKVSEKDGVCA